MADDNPPDYKGYKRPNYFNAQLLDEKDFQDEQGYHLEMLRRLNRGLNISGVVEGLQVTRSGAGVAVAPGMAIDALGREILLLNAATLDAPAFADHKGKSGVFVAISYGEAPSSDPADAYTGGTQSFKRFAPAPVLTAFETPPDGGANPPVILATVGVDANGNLTNVDNSARVPARSTMTSGMSLGIQDLALSGGLQLTPGSTRRVWLQGNDIGFGNAGDPATGLGYYNSAKPYGAAQALDGPVLYGRNGGALAVGGGGPLALRWDDEGQVGIGLQDDAPNARLHVAGGMLRLDAGEEDRAGLLFSFPDDKPNARASVQLFPAQGSDAGELALDIHGSSLSTFFSLRRNKQRVITFQDPGLIMIGESSDPQVVLDTSGLLSSKMWNVTQPISDFANQTKENASVNTSAKFATKGGTLLFFVTGSLYPINSGEVGLQVSLDNHPILTIRVGAATGDNFTKAFVGHRILKNIDASDDHTVSLQSINGVAGPGEYFNVTVMELPF